MSERVDRLARSAYNAASDNETDDGWWDRFSESERDEWRRATLAILAGIHEPTGAMIEAAYEMGGVFWGYEATERDKYPDDVWRAMIDAAKE